MTRSGCLCSCFFFQAEDGIRDLTVTGVQTCALPILAQQERDGSFRMGHFETGCIQMLCRTPIGPRCIEQADGICSFIVVDLVSQVRTPRSEEHTSELQSQSNLVCRLLLEKKKHKCTPKRCHPCTSSSAATSRTRPPRPLTLSPPTRTSIPAPRRSPALSSALCVHHTWSSS